MVPLRVLTILLRILTDSYGSLRIPTGPFGSALIPGPTMPLGAIRMIYSRRPGLPASVKLTR